MFEGGESLFPASTAEKTTVSAGKNGPFPYAGKIPCRHRTIFSGVHSGKNRRGRRKKWSGLYKGFFPPRGRKSPAEGCERTGFFNSVGSLHFFLNIHIEELILKVKKNIVFFFIAHMYGTPSYIPRKILLQRLSLNPSGVDFQTKMTQFLPFILNIRKDSFHLQHNQGCFPHIHIAWALSLSKLAGLITIPLAKVLVCGQREK